MYRKYDSVIHVVQTKSPKASLKYAYSESKLSELQRVIVRLISDEFHRESNVDLKRDTMTILRKKQYVNTGRTKWNALLLERLSEDWLVDSNAGFRLSDFSPHVGYNAHWRCKKCGYEFIALISNRVRGDECIRCKSRLAKPQPHESFAAVYPEKAKYWSSKNEFDPTEIMKRSSYIATWECRVCGYEWRRQVCVVAGLNSCGCDRCGRESARRKKFKPVEALDPRDKAVILTYESLSAAKAAGYPKAKRSIDSGKLYKGYLWRFKILK